MSFKSEERLDWRGWVTPVGLKSKPIHNWCVFPHSFTSDLVHALMDDWGLSENDHLLDPFAGAGTSILAAKEYSVPATGYDLSPFAVHAAGVKVANFNPDRLEKRWTQLKRQIQPSEWNGPSKDYPDLVRQALPGKLLGAFDAISRTIELLNCTRREKNFFRLALLRLMPKYSRAIATGGWLSWIDNRRNTRSLKASFGQLVQEMLKHLREIELPKCSRWKVMKADARDLPDRDGTYSAVITSPPYPNRHDYTRVFGVELMFGFGSWEDVRKLRYQSFHSHPEARPERPQGNGYVQPKGLRQIIRRVKEKCSDQRIPIMLEGYFLDMYLCLLEVSRVCKRGARIAFVVGNAQYCGEHLLVDELTAEAGEQAGLTCEKLIVTRYRGNSAQQMGKYGRNPSRESVVIFRKQKTASASYLP